MTLIDQLSRARYVSLTTFRKDGTGVATPVWLAEQDGILYVVTEADAWKVKRARRNSHVTLTPCDFRGRLTPGAPTVEGEATVLDEAGSELVRTLIARKYVLSRLGNWAAKVLRLPKKPVVGIAVKLAG